MTTFIVTLLPCVIFFSLLIREILKQKRFVLLLLTLWLAFASLYYALAVAEIIVTGVQKFQYLFLLNRLLATSVIPLIYIVGSKVMNRHIYPVGYGMMFLPMLLLVVITVVSEDNVLSPEVSGTIVYKPSIMFSFSGGLKFGWSPAELVIMTQSMWILIQSFNDYYGFGGPDHRTDNMNKLIRYFGLVGLTYFFHAMMGASYWIHNQEYAIINFCFNTFVVCLGMYIMRAELMDRRNKQAFLDAGYVSGAELTAVPADMKERASVVEEIARETEREQLSVQQVVDFANKPEIPSVEPDAVVGGVVSAMEVQAELTQKDLLALQLRELIEQQKVYLRAGIRIDDMALMLGTNRTYLARMMKENYGHTFAEYMNICRLKSAQMDMLHRRDASMETIALANGFNSSNTFNKVFNQYYGCSPAVWRKKNI